MADSGPMMRRVAWCSGVVKGIILYVGLIDVIVKRESVNCVGGMLLERTGRYRCISRSNSGTEWKTASNQENCANSFALRATGLERGVSFSNHYIFRPDSMGIYAH